MRKIEDERGAQNINRPAENPGGCECKNCGRIFIGEEWHTECGVCAAPAPVVTRDFLGQLVRDAWISWAVQQPNRKPSWLVPYAELSEADKEADRMIGERVAKWVIAIKGADWSSFVANPQARASSPAQPVQDERGAFEAWASSEGINTCRNVHNEDTYAYPSARVAWRAWQARAAASPVSGAARDVLAERARQVSVEGWTAEHDDGANDVAALADAAVCYAMHAAQTLAGAYSAPNTTPNKTWWPWDASWWKPTTPRRDLVKAGALILAEIERIDRAGGKS